MTRKTIQILIALIITLGLLLLVIDRDDDGTYAERAVFLAGFKEVANDATRISISGSSDGEDVTISRESGNWMVNARDNYAADISKLGQLVSTLANARIVEQKTSNPENYANLGVNDPGDGGNGRLVSIEGPGLNYSVIIGDSAQRDFRYARVPDQATSYLIDQNPPIPASASEWLVADIVDIPSSRIRNVSIEHADGESIVVEKIEEEQTDFDVLDVPEGRELSYATVGNGIAGALSDLGLDDVRKRIDAPAVTSVTFETWNGLSLSVKVIDEEEASWLEFAATSVDEEHSVDNEVAAINERLSGWQYQVADYKKNLLIRRWDDILKDAE
jgi:hypothetical protein